MAHATLSVPSSRMSQKVPSAPGLAVVSPAPSLLSLRSVIDFMPNNIRLRYKDAAKYSIWPECQLDGNGNAVEIDEEDEFDNSASVISSKLRRNLTVSTNNATSREYSKFGNDPVLIDPMFNSKAGRHRRTSENATTSGSYLNVSPFRQRKPMKQSTSGPSAYYSKDGVRLTPEMTRL